MSDYKCIIWDWNGTLLDDVPINIDIVNTLLSERGKKEIESVDFYKKEFSFPVIDFYRKVGFDLESEDFTLIARRYAFLFNERYPQAEIFPDAEELLRYIKHSGKEQLIISATEQSYLLGQVEYFELSHYFTDILGVSDVLGTSKIERAKRWIAEKGIDPCQVLLVGDTIHDYDTARAIGCDCVLVSRGHNDKERLLATGCPVLDDLKMKRVLIAPDSFKGTLGAKEVCRITASALKKNYPFAEIFFFPVADGGEGTAEAVETCLGGERVYHKVKSPLGRQLDAFYLMLGDKRAVIETAQASGLTLEEKNDALLASSYGTGQLIKAALDEGARELLIGIGGSAMTDGGTGCLSALGAKFLDAEGRELYPCGGNLEKITAIDLSGFDRRAEGKITLLCDVKNPLCGKNGAAYIFAPQKGADEKAVELLDRGLRHFAEACAELLGKDYSSCEGAGAAGGLAFALMAFSGAAAKSGIDTVLDLCAFDERVKNADLVITGEGRLDEQSLMGKVPFGVASRSKGKRVVALVGVNEASEETLKAMGIGEVTETNEEKLPFEEIKGRAEELLYRAAGKIKL